MPPEQVNELLDRLLDPFGRALSPEAARKIADLRAEPTAQRRMDELAERSSEGALTADERAEYEAYVTAATLIAILQQKARAALAGGAAA